MVTTSFLLGDILCNKDANGWIVKWAMKLCPFLMDFQSRMTLKSQALVDSITELTNLNAPPTQDTTDQLQMFFDGSLNIDGARAGVFNVSPNKDKLRYILRIHFLASNNVAEYKACLHGIRLAVELGIKRLYVYGNSTLVVNQLNKDWDTTHEKMDLYYKEIRKLEAKFYGIEYIHVVRDKNQTTDALSKLRSSRAQIPHGIFVQDLVKPSTDEGLDGSSKIEKTEALFVHTVQDVPHITNGNDWRTPFIRYLIDGTGLLDKTENERLLR